MRITRLALILWPGLPPLWLRSSLFGLAVAVGWAALLNLAMISSVVWVEILSPWTRAGVWLVVVIGWIGSATRCWPMVRAVQGVGGDQEGLFRRAQNEYLQGHWFEAEVALDRLLQHDPDDAEARLLLASLYRRSGRRDEALQALSRLARSDAADRWPLEIQRELALLSVPRQAEGQLDVPLARAA
jgi:tetratricopeptide (TPR) repeat protein